MIAANGVIFWKEKSRNLAALGFFEGRVLIPDHSGIAHVSHL